MLCYYGFFLAQIQASNVIAVFAVLIAFAGGIISFGSLKLMKNKMMQENKDKMASKVYVSTAISRVDVDVTNFKNNFDNYKDEHTKVHEKESETDKEFRDWMRQEMVGLRADVRAMKNNN